MTTIQQLYNYCYNRLVDITCGEVKKIHYIIGPKWEVCEFNDTVKIAIKALQYINYLKLNGKIDYHCDKLTLEKLQLAIETLQQISHAESDTWDDGFSIARYYYAKDTAYKAENCLNRLERYV